MAILFKIMEEKDGKVLNLFYPLAEGTKVVELGKCYTNRDKPVKDGGNGKYYDSGIHAYYEVKSTIEWLRRHISDGRAIYVCSGDVREDKATSKGKVALCSKLTVLHKFDYLQYIFDLQGEKNGIEQGIKSLNETINMLKSVAWDLLSEDERENL